MSDKDDVNPIDVLPFEFGRNENYLNSLKVMILVVFWFAPTSFLKAIKQPVLNIITTVLQSFIHLFVLALCVCVWFISRSVIMVAGIFGMIRVPQVSIPKNMSKG